MAKLSVIEARKAKSLEEINQRLARIEEALGIVDAPPAPPAPTPAPEPTPAEDPAPADAGSADTEA